MLPGVGSVRFVQELRLARWYVDVTMVKLWVVAACLVSDLWRLGNPRSRLLCVCQRGTWGACVGVGLVAGPPGVCRKAKTSGCLRVPRRLLALPLDGVVE